MTSRSLNRRLVYGDFQTPLPLADAVCRSIAKNGLQPKSIFEPTCGLGAFLQAAEQRFPDCAEIIGFDVNREYVSMARASSRGSVTVADIFDIDMSRTISQLQEPILVIGNPPWVTNSQMSVLRGKNLPRKANRKAARGLDAITGAANFDVSEWILNSLMSALSGKHATLAMLCKTAVARKVLLNSWQAGHQIDSASIRRISASKYFGASVEACLLHCELKPSGRVRRCNVYEDMHTDHCKTQFGYVNNLLVANVDLFQQIRQYIGPSPFRWRSGIKHDCISVMELTHVKKELYRNRLGELAELENTFVYPMLKGSELVRNHFDPSRYMLVTQHHTNAQTSVIESLAPKTWAYLNTHSSRLDNRASAVYRNRPRFGIFGIGPYSFAPWKLAIHGFTQEWSAQVVGSHMGKPIVLDDTTYFLPFTEKSHVSVVDKVLNSDIARSCIDALVFWDSKRPITARALSLLNLHAMAAGMGIQWNDVFGGATTDMFGASNRAQN